MHLQLLNNPVIKKMRIFLLCIIFNLQSSYLALQSNSTKTNYIKWLSLQNLWPRGVEQVEATLTWNKAVKKDSQIKQGAVSVFVCVH